MPMAWPVRYRSAIAPRLCYAASHSLPITIEQEDLIACRDEHAVIAEACVIATDSLREKVGAASVQVCKQFSAEHQSRVKKIADCAIALAEAFVSEADLRRQIVGAGFELTHPISGFPMLGNTIGRPADPNSALGYFLKALRAKGIEI